MKASTAAVAAGTARMSVTPFGRKLTACPSLQSSPELVERLHVDGVEALADAEQEDADHDEGHENGERDADLDDERHAFGAGAGENQPVLDRHEADDLAHRIAPRHHHQEAEEEHRKRKRKI